MHAILVTMGTDGDVFPYVGLGIKLRARGHRVTLTANEHFRDLALSHGFAFRPLVSHDEMHAVLANADFWHPLKSARAGAKMGVELLPRQYALIAELANGDDAVLVASPGVLAARIVQEKLSRPMATLLLQPWMVRSSIAPPIMPFGLSLPSWAPAPASKLYWRLIDASAYALTGRHINRLRASLGLAPVWGIIDWWVSPDLIIGLFPAWYGQPQADWPAHMKLAGFSMYEGERSEERGVRSENKTSGLSADLEDFLASGPPPVVFTLGTGMMHAADFFRAAVRACSMLNVRGIFLTKYRQQLPASLPGFIRHFTFAPFLELFPRCAAVVHHGGAGTVAKALKSRTPQLILPLAWDQPDNAARVKRLGVGDWLGARRRKSRHLAEALAGLITPSVQARCHQIAGLFGPEDGLDNAAALIEELAIRKGDSRPSAS